MIQMINNPHMIEDVRPLTSKMPTLNRIVPIVRIRSFFSATTLHLQFVPCMGNLQYHYLTYFAGSASNFFLHPGAQKKYFLP